jgi:hypothetical protein
MQSFFAPQLIFVPVGPGKSLSIGLKGNTGNGHRAVRGDFGWNEIRACSGRTQPESWALDRRRDGNDLGTN